MHPEAKPGATSNPSPSCRYSFLRRAFGRLASHSAEVALHLSPRPVASEICRQASDHEIQVPPGHPATHAVEVLQANKAGSLTAGMPVYNKLKGFAKWPQLLPRAIPPQTCTAHDPFFPTTTEPNHAEAPDPLAPLSSELLLHFGLTLRGQSDIRQFEFEACETVRQDDTSTNRL